MGRFFEGFFFRIVFLEGFFIIGSSFSRPLGGNISSELLRWLLIHPPLEKGDTGGFEARTVTAQIKSLLISLFLKGEKHTNKD
jgi:hypothetical protein